MDGIINLPITGEGIACDVSNRTGAISGDDDEALFESDSEAREGMVTIAHRALHLHRIAIEMAEPIKKIEKSVESHID